MNYKFLANVAVFSGLIILTTNAKNPVLSQVQTNQFDEQYNSRIVPAKYPTLNALPIVVHRSTTNSPFIIYKKVSDDGRYELIEFISALTQEVRELPSPAPRSLYRLAKVHDRETGKVLEVALPIRFEQ